MKDCNLIEPLTKTLNLLVFLLFLTQGDPGFEYLRVPNLSKANYWSRPGGLDLGSLYILPGES